MIYGPRWGPPTLSDNSNLLQSMTQGWMQERDRYRLSSCRGVDLKNLRLGGLPSGPERGYGGEE